jgi:hypothetical protein
MEPPKMNAPSTAAIHMIVSSVVHRRLGEGAGSGHTGSRRIIPA